MLPDPTEEEEEEGRVGSGYLWEWQDENGAWHSYHPETVRLLEACRICGVGSVEIDAGGRQYSVDTAKMTQTNAETSVCRNIRRIDLSSVAGEPIIILYFLPPRPSAE